MRRLHSRKRIALSTSLLAAVTCSFIDPPANGEIVPNPGVADARIRVAPYSSDEVYRLSGFVGFQTDLEFAPGETFVGLAAGDIHGLSFVAEANHLFLKPRAAKVETNLTIVTSRHTYQIAYSSSADRPGATQEATYALRFTYPPEPGATSEALTEKALESHRARNIDYWYCGNPVLKPVAASDDGVHTRLTFAAHAEQPAIFVLNEDGSEALLNFSVDEGDVILHRIAKRLILRRGALAGCIVNEAFVGGGERLKSNTTSDLIERAIRGRP